MQQLGQYVISLSGTAMICGVLISLFRDGNIKSILRMLCGIILIIAVISPLSDLNILELSVTSGEYFREGESIASNGEDLAWEEVQRCIQQQLEAYILDKADALNISVTPQVELNSEGLPVEVRLWGQCSDNAKGLLTAIITNDLGIPEEDQKWTGKM